MSKLWLIKDKKGRIFGPYNEKEVCFYIGEGEFKGEELCSSYPVGKWKPLSTHSVFYEKILAKLNEKSDSAFQSKESISTEESSIGEVSTEEEAIEPTRIITPREESTSSKAKEKKKVRIKLSKKFKEELSGGEEEESVIEMETFKGRLIDKLIVSLKVPFLFFVLLSVCAVVFFIQDEKGKNEEQVRLLSVSETREPLKKEELGKKLQKALNTFFKSGVSDYISSQLQYVNILEGNPGEVIVYHYLCLVYLEIWSFSRQDTRDKNTLRKTLNLISTKDRGGIFSDSCKSVKALIDKDPEKSLMITNSSLNAIDESYSPIFFYYLKAKALIDLNKKTEARAYLQNIRKLRSEWIAPYMLDAQMFYEKGEYDLASKLYERVLSVFPGHISAGLRMGILEYKHFKKTQKSEARLQSIFHNLNSLVEPHIMIEAYIVLANVYLRQNDRKKVVEYLNKATALDPEHPDVVALKLSLGEKGNFENTKIKAWGLIYKGDMLVSQGKCSSARDYFQKAYEADNRRNSLAALRMAQCYWQSGHSGQAIRWLRNSINADSKMLEAYFLLADYLSYLYDFESAKDILDAAKNQRPSNYDLFKAYALLSFRQKKYNSAVSYAKRSLDFYTSDTEIYVLLSKTYRALGKNDKAFANAERAIQEDGNNIQARIVYALGLDPVYSFHKAESYFKKLIDHFPLITDYSQALGEFYFEKEMYEEALALFEGIIQKDPKFKPAYIFLGRISQDMSRREGGRLGQKYEQALRYFLDASLLDISDPEPVFYSGLTHMDHEQYQSAENEFEKILQINPNYPLIHYYIGRVNFLQQGEENLEKALKFARTQAAKDPDHFLPYKLAGDIYRSISKGVFEDPQEKRVTYELCAKEYQKALKYLKTDLETSSGLIECYKGAGDLDSALQLALQLIKEEGLSGHPQFYREIASIFELKNQYEKARTYYISYFDLEPGAKDRKQIEARINRLINKKQKPSKKKK